MKKRKHSAAQRTDRPSKRQRRKLANQKRLLVLHLKKAFFACLREMNRRPPDKPPANE